MRAFILSMVLTIACAFAYSQCFYKGLPYNVGAIITFDDGTKNKCNCIIPTAVGHPCTARWDRINPPPTQPPRQAPPQPPAAPVIQQYVYTTNISDIKPHGFPRKFTDGYLMYVSFESGMGVTFRKTGAVHSYDDLTNLELEGTLNGACLEVEKWSERGGMGGSPRETDAPLNAQEQAYRKEWVGQTIDITFQAKSVGYILGNDNHRMGLTFKILKNTIIRDRHHPEVTDALPPENLEIKLYFEPQKKNGTTLPVSFSFDEKGIATGIYKALSLNTSYHLYR